VALPIPPMRADVERRLLVNYRVDPEVAQTLIPEGLRPQLVDGSAVAGVCLIRLARFRPSGLPGVIGWRGENAAHRIAVEWDGPAGPRSGVYIPQRHSASRFAVLVGGRLFPGMHEHARVRAEESRDRLRVGFDAPGLHLDVDVEVVESLESRLFDDTEQASEFFRKDALGYSPSRRPGRFEGLRLDTDAWSVAPARPHRVESSFFDALPAGSAELDHVLVMRDVPVRWSAPRPRSVRFPAPAPATAR